MQYLLLHFSNAARISSGNGGAPITKALNEFCLDGPFAVLFWKTLGCSKWHRQIIQMVLTFEKSAHFNVKLVITKENTLILMFS